MIDADETWDGSVVDASVGPAWECIALDECCRPDGPAYLVGKRSCIEWVNRRTVRRASRQNNPAPIFCGARRILHRTGLLRQPGLHRRARFRTDRIATEKTSGGER